MVLLRYVQISSQPIECEGLHVRITFTYIQYRPDARYNANAVFSVCKLIRSSPGANALIATRVRVRRLVQMRSWEHSSPCRVLVAGYCRTMKSTEGLTLGELRMRDTPN